MARDTCRAIVGPTAISPRQASNICLPLSNACVLSLSYREPIRLIPFSNCVHRLRRRLPPLSCFDNPSMGSMVAQPQHAHNEYFTRRIEQNRTCISPELSILLNMNVLLFCIYSLGTSKAFCFGPLLGLLRNALPFAPTR